MCPRVLNGNAFFNLLTPVISCSMIISSFDFEYAGAKVRSIIAPLREVPYTAYTEAEYQGVTDQVPYTGGSTDTYTGKSFNNFCCSITFFSIF